MRQKLFISVILILVSALSFAQGLVSKKITDEGVTLLYKPIHITSKWQPTIDYILLVQKKNDGAISYSIVCRIESTKQNLSFDRGMKLLIKTGKEKVLQLENVSGEDGISYYDACGNHRHFLRCDYSGKGIYIYSVLYAIQEHELNQLANEGITSLRFQTSANDINCDYPIEKTQKLSVYFSSAINSIEEAIDPRMSF